MMMKQAYDLHSATQDGAITTFQKDLWNSILVFAWSTVDTNRKTMVKPVLQSSGTYKTVSSRRYMKNSICISGLEKLSNLLQNFLMALLSVIDRSKVTVICFRTVAQLKSRFAKATSCPVPLMFLNSTSWRRSSTSASVLQFDGWPHGQSDGHGSWNLKWKAGSSASFVTPVHILRRWNTQGPNECPCAATSRDKNVMPGSLVMSSIKYCLSNMSAW